MSRKTRLLLTTTVLAAAIALAGPTWAAIQYMDDGAVQNTLNGWDLPAQGTCPAAAGYGYTGIDTRAECVALRLNVVQASCTSAANLSWTTSGVCNDLVNNASQGVCEAKGDRLWNAATGVCAVVMMDDDRNNVNCMKHGGNWVTTGTCTGSWVMPARTAYTPNLLTSNGAGDQCLRCHNTVTQYNGPRVRDTEDTLYMGHKNMARKVTAPKAWGGPPLVCTNPLYTTEEDCIQNGGVFHPADAYVSDDSGNLFYWGGGQITVNSVARDVTWIYGDWLAPLPRAIYKAPASTSQVCSDPRGTTANCVSTYGGTLVNNAGISYSCGRCHTTGWTSDATIQTAKEPEKSFPGITWDRLSNAPANVVNLSGGIAGDSNKYSSWDVWGISCTRCHSSAIDTTTGTGSPLQYSAPAGMSTHHNNMTGTDISSGACSDARWTSEAVCTSNGGTWLTACSLASTPAICSVTAADEATCIATVGNTWVAAPFCSNARYNNQADCVANAFTWQAGWCKSGTAPSGTTCSTGTYRANGTQASCQVAGGAWSFTSCSLEGVCNKGTCSDALYTDQINCEAAGKTWTGIAGLTACTAAGGQYSYATDVIRCEDAGGRWTGNYANRGQIITRVCMDCHRQETGGLPYDSTNPATALKVGPAHGDVTFVSHTAGNQFLNSPHGKFTGTFDQIATGKFNFAGTGEYKSFFQIDAEAANTGNGCTGCHEVHTSVVTGEKPFREECTECHSGPYNIDLTKINHLGGVGTPLEKMAEEPAEPCIVCHMPGGKHLWRINASASYSTLPLPAALTTTVNANTSPDGTYTNAVWIDVDDACGQCHGGGTSHAETTGTIATGSKALTVVNPAGFAANQRILVAGAGTYEYDELGEPVRGDFPTYIISVVGNTINLAGAAPIGVTGAAVAQNPVKNGGNYRTKAVLAAAAEGMHGSAGISYAVGLSASQVPDTLGVTATATTSCGTGGCPSFKYVWSWGDGSADTTTTDPVVTATHTYAAAGTRNITLTVMLNQPPPNFLAVGSSTQSVTVDPVIATLTAGATSCTWNANTWTMQVVDASTGGVAPLRISVDWGDGGVRSFGAAGATFNRTYVVPGAFPVTVRATDSRPVSDDFTCATTATPAYFAISGSVKKADNTTPFGGVAVTLKKSGVSVKSVTTGTNGAYNLGSLKPGTYTVSFTRSGYTFPVLGPYTIGPSVNTADVKANSALGATQTTPRTRLTTVTE